MGLIAVAHGIYLCIYLYISDSNPPSIAFPTKLPPSYYPPQPPYPFPNLHNTLPPIILASPHITHSSPGFPTNHTLKPQAIPILYVFKKPFRSLWNPRELNGTPWNSMEGLGTQWKEQVTKRKLLVTKEPR
jgi:hypothetical protein